MRKVTVIGGGLAGLYSAYSAALHGAKVTLYEKGKIGTKHDCGELFTEIYNAVPAKCKLNKIRFFEVYIDGDKVSIDFGENSPFVMTDKCNHEAFMKDLCQSFGVEVIENTRTKMYQEKDSYYIDASGTSLYNCSMGKAIVYVIKREDEEKDTAVFRVRDDLMGYSWAFPKDEEYINTGEGVVDYKYKVELMKISSFRSLFRGGGLLPMPDIKQYCLNMSGNTLSSIKVGNAAGLVNSFLGAGEHLAVLSGMLAGELVASRRERHYYHALDEIIGDEMRFGTSMYQFMRKQDMESVKKIIKSDFVYLIDNEIINKTVRKAMSKWMTIAPVKEDELVKFIDN